MHRFRLVKRSLCKSSKQAPWLCGIDLFDELRQLGDLLTLKESQVPVENIQVCVGICLALTNDSGNGLDPELLHGFYSRQLAVASEERQLI